MVGTACIAQKWLKKHLQTISASYAEIYTTDIVFNLVAAIVLSFSCFSALVVDFFTLYVPIKLKKKKTVKAATPSNTITADTATTIDSKPIPPAHAALVTVTKLLFILSITFATLKYFYLKLLFLSFLLLKFFGFYLFSAVDIHAPYQSEEQRAI